MNELISLRSLISGGPDLAAPASCSSELIKKEQTEINQLADRIQSKSLRIQELVSRGKAASASSNNNNSSNENEILEFRRLLGY